LNLDEMVARAISDVKTASPQPEWKISPLPTIYADNAMLRQVWFNLLDNAAKYSRKSAAPVITVGHRLDEAAAEDVFWVHDNGVGFDMTYGDKLFGVFQRLHSADEFEGTGIGLALVRRIITRHGGRTWAEGKLGEGATFYFTLPRVQPEFNL
jgi:light-regulated signal transduction histidine kinase (bacteriophytochrome)